MKMKWLLLAVAAFGLRQIKNEEQLTMGWEEWKAKFPKWEAGLQHDDSKEAAFNANIAFIKECNQKYKNEEQGFFCGVNEWTDMSSAEFKNVMLPSEFNSTRPRNE